MKLCQGPKCHTYDTTDRLRGPKGMKVPQTRRRSSFYYLTQEQRPLTEQQYNDSNYTLNER